MGSPASRLLHLGYETVGGASVRVGLIRSSGDIHFLMGQIPRELAPAWIDVGACLHAMNAEEWRCIL